MTDFTVHMSQISQGGDVPEEYYLDIKELYEHMKYVTVPRGEKHCVDFQVDKLGSILRYVTLSVRLLISQH